MLVIRRVKISDISEINRIVYENLKEEYDPNILWQFAEVWPEGSLVAEDMGTIRGYLLAIKHTQSEARILLFVVIPINQNGGLGSYMFNIFLNQCALIGLRSICLEVRISNYKAIKFYTRFGFIIHTVLKCYYKDSENAYLMRRGL